VSITVKARRPYSVPEEIAHAVTHGVGAVLAVVAFIFLIMKADGQGTAVIVAVSIYASCAVLMYLCSTLYHSAYNSRYQPLLKMLDHSSIYFKIAGSYTPFALITLPPATGLWVMAGAWGAAFAGTAFKFTAFLRQSGKRYNWLSLAFYLSMGWAGVLMISPLAALLPADAIFWLIAGGGLYTAGAIFYTIKSVAYFHAVWHVFVLAGSACHFAAIYFYVL